VIAAIAAPLTIVAAVAAPNVSGTALPGTLTASYPASIAFGNATAGAPVNLALSVSGGAILVSGQPRFVRWNLEHDRDAVQFLDGCGQFEYHPQQLGDDVARLCDRGCHQPGWYQRQRG
jgi:hypothetical protein